MADPLGHGPWSAGGPGGNRNGRPGDRNAHNPVRAHRKPDHWLRIRKRYDAAPENSLKPHVAPEKRDLVPFFRADLGPKILLSAQAVWRGGSLGSRCNAPQSHGAVQDM